MLDVCKLAVSRRFAPNFGVPGVLMWSVSLAEEEVSCLVAVQNSEPRHEALGNVTTEDVYYGRMEATPKSRRELKAETLARRKAVNLGTKPKVSTISSTQLCQMF